MTTNFAHLKLGGPVYRSADAEAIVPPDCEFSEAVGCGPGDEDDGEEDEDDDLSKYQ